MSNFFFTPYLTANNHNMERETISTNLDAPLRKRFYRYCNKLDMEVIKSKSVQICLFDQFPEGYSINVWSYNCLMLFISAFDRNESFVYMKKRFSNKTCSKWSLSILKHPLTYWLCYTQKQNHFLLPYNFKDQGEKKKLITKKLWTGNFHKAHNYFEGIFFYKFSEWKICMINSEWVKILSKVSSTTTDVK